MDRSGLVWMCVAALVVSMALGGGTKTFQAGDAVAEAVCLPILVFSLHSLAGERRSRLLDAGLAIGGLCVLLPLIQLIPLPPALWMKLPGREAVAHGFELAGAAPPWLGLSLAPAATIQSALSLIPPLAVFATAAQLGLAERRLVLAVFMAFATLSVVVGLLQKAQGSDSPLYFYFYPGETDIVGFFANRNHFSALLYTGALISTTWALALMTGGAPRLSERRFPASPQPVAIVVLFAALAAFLFGIVLAGSRAGYAMGMLATLLGFVLVAPFATRAIRLRPAILAAVVVAVVVAASVNYYLYYTLQRLELGFVDLDRSHLGALVRPVLSHYFPVGSGFGSFVPTYQAQEVPSQALYGYVNRAHDDYLEWGVEGGLAAYLVVALGVAWLVWANVAQWRSRGADFVDASLARACAVAPALLLAHSAFDYPLRTVALMSVTALCAGCALEPLASAQAAGAIRPRQTQMASGGRPARAATAKILPFRSGAQGGAAQP